MLGVNETDARCLEILLQEVPDAAPTLLARRLGLTTGALTPMLDRLEKLGYLTRSPHPTDRRKTIVRATPEAAKRAMRLIAPLIDDGQHQLLMRYSVAEIQLIIDFLQRAEQLQQQHLERLRAIATETSSRQAAGQN